IITTSNNIVAGSVPLGISPTSVYYDTFLNRLYVTNTGDNTVTVFDASNVSIGVNPAIPTLATVSVGSAPVSVAALPNGQAFYVANQASNTVSVVSSKSFAVVGTVAVGQKPVFIATEPSSTKVYTANSAGGNISIIQTFDNTVVLNMSAPQQDPNCDPKVQSCALQQPVMVITK
ncbi:MAG TPA: YncE family protein, partial [Terriglobales bacterium]